MENLVKKQAEIFFQNLPKCADGFTPKEILPILRWVDLQLGYEKEYGVGSLDDQLDWFGFLEKMAASDEISGARSLHKKAVFEWSKNTSNVFGQAFYSGNEYGELSGNLVSTRRAQLKLVALAKARTARANQGRKVIGHASRMKVEAAYKMKFKNLSKEQAALKISEEVGLATGTVRRYLTKL